MAITKKRRKGDVETEAALARLQEVAREQAERLGPYADQARKTASRRMLQARGWTAPRLETAAQRVEDTVAPRVSDLLIAAAQKVEPNQTRRGLRAAARRNRRRVPRALLVGGVAAVGAAAVYGVVKVRQASQDAEWRENLDQARAQVRETRDQLAAKARNAREKMAGTAEEVKEDAQESKDVAAAGAKRAAQEFNGRAGQ